MKERFDLSQESFDSLLKWLASDREAAGKRYEDIRSGLITFFRSRGCDDAALLADQTINRVASKIETFDVNSKNKTLNVFYGFASKIYLEFISRTRGREVALDPDSAAATSAESNRADDDREAVNCLDRCLDTLVLEDKGLVVKYYSEEKKARLAMRNSMAAGLGITSGALHTRIYRLRNSLKTCIENCIASSDAVINQ